jgi:Domain of unknown function (DUF4386)
VLQRASSASLARSAGLCYLVVIGCGLFAEAAVRGSLVVPGDAAATVRSIAANESLWRWGLLVHLVYLLPSLAVNVLIYELCKPVHATLARLAFAFALTSVAIEATSLLTLCVPLAIRTEGGALAALGEGQGQALAYLAVRLFTTGFGLALVFFAGFCVLTGGLIIGSRLVPPVIGALMIAAGAAYFLNTVTLILSPALWDRIFPAILAPCLLGELSLALWLVVKGVRTEPVAAGRRRSVLEQL